jgi:mannose-6-phosphate isomerase
MVDVPRKKLERVAHGPITFSPERPYRLFTGGLLLDQLLKLDDPGDGHYGEAWYASTIEAANVRGGIADKNATPQGLSRIIVDNQAVLFRDLVEQFPDTLLGPPIVKEFGKTVPIIAKFIDTAVRHVVQVHPSKAFVNKYFNFPSGRDEAWVILKIRDNLSEPAHVYLGFKDGMTRESFEPILLRGNSEELLNCLNRITVSPRETYYVPAGVPHALGPGLFIIEIHEPADYIFRAEKHWLDMELSEVQRHLTLGFDKLAEAFEYTGMTAEETKNMYRYQPKNYFRDSGKEVSMYFGERPDKAFGILTVTVFKPSTLSLGSQFSVGLVTRGESKVRWQGGETMVTPAKGIFFPAALDGVEIIPDDSLEMVMCFLKGDFFENE